jgi:dienelactone hydrolase
MIVCRSRAPVALVWPIRWRRLRRPRIRPALRAAEAVEAPFGSSAIGALDSRDIAAGSQTVAEIVLFHSALGLRPGVVSAADRLRAAGHTVHTPDLFEGDAPLDAYAPAMARIRAIGIPTLAARARAAVEPLPRSLVYAGFSIGASFAAMLAATRPGARAALLLHGAPDPAKLGLAAWPAAAPVQIHFMLDDRWRTNSAITKLARLVRRSGAECTVFDYPGSAHLFADPGLPAEFDPQAAELMWARVIEVLSGLDRSEG